MNFSSSWNVNFDYIRYLQIRMVLYLFHVLQIVLCKTGLNNILYQIVVHGVK